jgi:transcriptional regulator with XRE-family HTH domain
MCTGDNVKESIVSIILDELDLTQSKLAEILFTSRQNISRWCDDNSIADDFKVRLSKLTGIPIKFFISGIDFNDTEIREILKLKSNRISERIRIIKAKGESYYDDIILSTNTNSLISNKLLNDEWLDQINNVISDHSSKPSFNLFIKALSIYSLRDSIENLDASQLENIEKILRIFIEVDNYSHIEKVMKKILEEDNGI